MPVNKLSSGGIIANYRCPASCGHCVYGCSPSSEPGYITEETAASVCEIIRRFGCSSVHIGGGEPFLNIKGLIGLLKAVLTSGLELEYIETNGAWITEDMDRNKEILRRITKAGGDCIMVSADPFHIEWIPFWKPLTLIRLLEEMNISHFIWQQRYVSVLSRLDWRRTYNADELRQALGYDIVEECIQSYGMNFNGRALNLIRDKAPRRQPAEFLSRKPCGELWKTGHFHADYLGRYIPPLCTGIGIPLEELGKDIESGPYPVLHSLFNKGVFGLWEYALENGYEPISEGYVSKCDLCLAIRKYFVLKHPELSAGLSPLGFYQQNY